MCLRACRINISFQLSKKTSACLPSFIKPAASLEKKLAFNEEGSKHSKKVSSFALCPWLYCRGNKQCNYKVFQELINRFAALKVCIRKLI